MSEPLVKRCARALRTRGAHVETGRFGARMLVESANDGPASLVVDS